MTFAFATACKDALLHLFFPHLCAGCFTDMLDDQEMICSACMESLPFTQFENLETNPVEKLFWGRTPIKHAFSIFYYLTRTPIQQIIHQIKYKDNPALGVYMGKIMGLSMRNFFQHHTINLMIPMPLHPKKEYKRGYNQAAKLCQGIHETTYIEYREDLLIRNFNTSTQTKKTRIERWQNVSDVFEIVDPSAMEHQHILLVDDVITTGASTEACANLILKYKAASVSICSLAYTI